MENIILRLYCYGGFGDVVAGSIIADEFINQKIPFQIEFSDKNTKEEFNKVVNLEKYKDLVRTKINYEKNDYVFTIIGGNDISRMLTKPTIIRINEYDQETEIYPKRRNENVVFSGLSFDSKKKIVQTGIYTPSSIDEKIENIENKEENLRQLLINLKAFTLARNLEEEANIAVAYTGAVGNNWTFLEIYKKAEKKLDKQTLIFCGASDYLHNNIEQKAYELNFSYYSLSNDTHTIRDTPITVVNLGVIQRDDFEFLLLASNSLSMVTGDLSLTTMIQKSGSKLRSPFFYHAPAWKSKLKYAIAEKIFKSNFNAGNMFLIYDEVSRADAIFERDYDEKLEILSELIVNDEKSKFFCDSISTIKDLFVSERAEHGIKKPEELWSVNNTVAAIAKNIFNGADYNQATYNFVPN